MLGALGFTPGQVVRALLVEQTALGVAASAVGLIGAWAAIRTPAFIGPPNGIPVALTPLPALWMALAAAVTVATVAVATVVPAWRAGRVSPVAAVAAAPPRGRLSRLARVGLLVRLPVPLVLGARDAFTRRLPAALTIVGVALPMAMITIALTCWTTLDGFTSDPGRIDLAAALTVYPGSESIHAEQAQLARDPQIAADYPGAEFDTLLPGATATFTARAMGTSARPYPFGVAQGAMFDSYNEAIAGQGLLDLLHYNVGDWIVVTIDGVPMIFDIVGRTLDPIEQRRRPRLRPRRASPSTAPPTSPSSTASSSSPASTRPPPASSCCRCRATASRSSRPPTRPTASAWSRSSSSSPSPRSPSSAWPTCSPPPPSASATTSTRPRCWPPSASPPARSWPPWSSTPPS